MKQLLIVAALSFLVFSCKKNDSNNSSNPTNNLTEMEKLLIGSWSLQGGTDSLSNNNGERKITVIETRSCEADDTYTFKNDHTYTVSDGATICSPGNGYDMSVGWSINKDNVLRGFIHLNPTLHDQNPSIIQLDNSLLKLEYRASTNLPGGHWTYNVYVFTFKRK